MTLAWIIVGLILLAWGVVEVLELQIGVRAYLRRADQTVEGDLIAETNKEYEEWMREVLESIDETDEETEELLREMQKLIPADGSWVKNK